MERSIRISAAEIPKSSNFWEKQGEEKKNFDMKSKKSSYLRAAYRKFLTAKNR